MEFNRLVTQHLSTIDTQIELTDESLNLEMEEIPGVSIEEWLLSKGIKHYDWKFSEGYIPVSINSKNVLWCEPYFVGHFKGVKITNKDLMPKATKIFFIGGKKLIVKEKYEIVKQGLGL